jgi:hypothetical protein
VAGRYGEGVSEIAGGLLTFDPLMRMRGGNTLADIVNPKGDLLQGEAQRRINQATGGKGTLQSVQSVDLTPVVDAVNGLRDDLKNTTLRVKPETDGRGAAVGDQAAPGLKDR